MNARAIPRVLFPLALLALGACSAEHVDQAGDPNLFEVRRDSLPITVKENGELQALHEEVVRSQVEGQSAIISIIPEGTQVQAGDQLVELDVSDLVDKRNSQDITVTRAQASWQQSQEDRRILDKALQTQKGTAEANLKIAEMEFEKLLGRNGKSGSKAEGHNADMVKKLAELVDTPTATAPAPVDAAEQKGPGDAQPALVSQVDPHNYASLVDKINELLAADGSGSPALDHEMGDMANQVLQQVDKIRLAMANLKVKEDTYSHSRRLASKAFITRNELEKDQLDWQSTVSQVTLAWNDLDLLINYTLAKSRIKLRQDVDNARLELERVLASNSAALFKAKSDEDSKKLELDFAKERWETLDRQIKSAIIKAPTPGLVIYAKIDKGRGGEAVREGVQVRERQELIILPDTTKMRCVVKVQEAQVDKLQRGQPAYVQAEAFPEVFTGHVTSVAPVADSNSNWMTSDRKVYTTIVELDGDNPDTRLRSRMAASVTIQVDTIPNVLPVPLQAVRRVGSVNYVWKKTPNGPAAEVVQAGHHNTERVEVTKGVAEGDLVYLVPPAGVQEPKFEQPALPALPPLKDQKDSKDQKDPDPAGDGGVRTDGDGQRRGGPGKGGSRMGPGMMKKLTEMTPAELAEFKDGLGKFETMLENMRDRMGEDQVQKFNDSLAALRKALDAGKVEDAEAARLGLRAAMPRMGNRGGGGPGGGPGDGSAPPRERKSK